MKKILSLILLIALTLTFAVSCSKDKGPDGTVNISALANHDNVIAKMLTGEIDYAVLPEPKATAAINQAKQEGHNYSIKFNLSEEWSAVSDNDLAMGCIVVNSSFIEAYEKSVVDFLKDYKSSIEFIGDQTNKDAAAQMIVDAGIIPKLPIAKSALANLYGAIVYSDGNYMKETLIDFYDAIGQEKPVNDFYYIPDENAEGTSEKIKIGVMNGPTGMGMAKLINDGDSKYEFKPYADPTLATADLANGIIDMACIPTNTAANLSVKGKDINVAAINCLGSLYIIVKDGVETDGINSLIDKTLYYGVPTSTTEPILRHIFKKNNIEVSKK